MRKRVVVYDTGQPLFLGNRILDPAFAARFPGASLLPVLKGYLEEQDCTMVTADVFLAERKANVEGYCLSEAVTPLTRRLFERGVVPKVVLSGESPNVIPWFYRRLDAFIRPFRHAFLFRGFSSRVPSSVMFHPFLWPTSRNAMLEGPPWAERGLLVMVVGNKDRYMIDLKRPFRSLVRASVNWSKWRYYKAVDSLFRFPDLYESRFDAIAYFCGRSDFRLFGKGWERRNTVGSRGKRFRFHTEPAECEDKTAVMAKFRFALCFENCAFPGYVTEKIFDCLLAGCVPVYFGAPDITDFCPKECFVDFRDFLDFGDLERALREFPEHEWDAKRQAIQEYLGSNMFHRHRQESLASELTQCLLE
jgi:alpha(1,3/1,4) fucosyltransferase